MNMKICLVGILFTLFSVAGYIHAQSINVDVERATVEVGAPIRAIATVRNDKKEKVEWILAASIYTKDPRIPVPRDFVKHIKLEPGKQSEIPLSFPTEGFVYEGEFQLITKLFDTAYNPLTESIQIIRLTGGLKRLDVILKTCKDSACNTPAKLFMQGETVYITYTANANLSRVEVSIVFPDKSEITLELPAKIIVTQAGDYQINAVIMEPGYQNVRKSSFFGVIEPSHELNQPSKLKQIE